MFMNVRHCLSYDMFSGALSPKSDVSFERCHARLDDVMRRYKLWSVDFCKMT